jgi:hypothetical protein
MAIDIVTMESYTNQRLWEEFESDMADDTDYTEIERASWLDFIRLSEMTNEELLAEVTELDKITEEEEDLDEDVRAVLRNVSARYWDVYSLRMAKDLSKLSVK